MLTALFGKPRQATVLATDDGPGWADFFARHGGRTRAGVSVSEDNALVFSAVMCATRVLVEAVGGLPLITYQRLDDDGREPAIDHPVYDLLKTAPNPEMDAVCAREGRTGHQINWGNGFFEIERAVQSDRILGLWPIHPERIRATQPGFDGVDATEFPYMVRNTDTSLMPMKRSEILHIPGIFPEDGQWGKGVVAYAREAIGYGLAVQRHGARFFGRGGQTRGVLKLPGMKNAEARREFRKEWKEVHDSPDGEDIIILPVENGEYIPTTVPNEAAQFIETGKLTVASVAQYYRIPLYMLGEFPEAAARASVEAQGIEFVVYSLMPWLRKWEARCNLSLLSMKERKTFFIEHVLAGLIRGDFKTRLEGYRIAITTGLMTVNECRRLENLPGIGPAGDMNLVQLNQTTLDALYENDGLPPGTNEAPPPADQGDFFDKKPPDDAANAAGDPNAKDAGGFDQWTRRTANNLANLGNGRVRSQSRTLEVQPVPDSMLIACRGVFLDVLGRMATKESNAIRREVKNADFLNWVGEFYGKHKPLLAAALRPAATMAASLGNACDAEVMAGEIVTAAQDELKLAYEVDTPAQFEQRLADWPSKRPAWLVDDLLELDLAGDGHAV